VWITKYRYKVLTNVTDEVINEYIDHHREANEPQHATRICLE
jgi:hypothetical protein